MRHLFFVHSQITFIVSNKVIKHLQLNQQDCVFLIHRGKSSDYISLGVKMVDFPFNPGSVDSFPLFNKFWRTWAKINELDEFINEVNQNKEFQFYTPHTLLKHLALICSHNKCKGVNIIEEGLASYISTEVIDKGNLPQLPYSLYKKILWKLNFLNRLNLVRSFIDDRYSQAFGLTDYSFSDLSRRVILGLPTLDEYHFTQHDIVLDEHYENILVFDALVEANSIDSGTLIMCLMLFFKSFLEKGNSKLHIKYHPDQVKADKTIKLIRELFSQYDNLEIIEIPQMISLEKIALQYDPTFFVFSSSVGLYAALYGRKVYTLNKLVERFHPPFSKKIKRMPFIFNKKVDDFL